MIVDIGSGHKPHNRADILLEHRITGSEHRWGKKLLIDRPTIIYDGYKIPLKNKSFEFSICSHVLEHVSSPTKFLNEISRISQAGYIETPSAIAELIFPPYDQHKWVIHSTGKEVVIRKKGIEDTSKFGWLFQYLCDKEKGFENFFYWKRRGLFLVEHYWKEKILFRMLRKSQSTFIDLNDLRILSQLCKPNRSNYRPKIPRTRRKSSDKVFKFLEKQILTPCCFNNALYHKTYYSCCSCKRKYYIRKNRINLYK